MPSPAELADRISEARASRAPLSAEDSLWSGLDEQTAGQVADLLFRQWGAAGSPYWKLGAVDPDSQARLGVSGPVFAPVVPDRVRVGEAVVRVELASMLQPKFEGEVGVLVGERSLVVPCVEIADSRFSGWRLPPSGLIADACLQSMLVFGTASEPPAEVSVLVSHNGHVVASGTQSWADAASRLSVLPRDCGATHVATGAMTPLIDVAEGEWTFDFGELGSLVLEVV